MQYFICYQNHFAWDVNIENRIYDGNFKFCFVPAAEIYVEEKQHMFESTQVVWQSHILWKYIEEEKLKYRSKYPLTEIIILKIKRNHSFISLQE